MINSNHFSCTFQVYISIDLNEKQQQVDVNLAGFLLIPIQIQILLCRNTNIYLGDLYVEQQHAHSSQPILLYLGLRVGEGFPLGYQLFFQQTIVVTNTQLKVVMNGKRSIMMPKLDFILSFIQLDTNQYYKAISDARLKG